MPAEVVLKTLNHVWNVLTPFQVPKALLGGLAVAVWKHLRLTQDVDILVGIEEADLDRILAGLKKAGLRPKGKSPVMQIGPQKILQMLYQPPGSFLDIQVDLLVAQGEYAVQALKRSRATSLPGLDGPIEVLSCEDLILHKLVAGRILDYADSAALLRANKENLDLDYMRHWLGELGVKKDWDLVWEEAFPGTKQQ